MDIRAVIESALRSAVDEMYSNVHSGSEHRRRSQNFVKKLAEGLREHYRDQKTIRVFSKDSDENRTEFGMNELLYDVMVCDTAKTPSAQRRAELTYVTKALWQIESEFAHDSRQALYDFNKLVVGAAEKKLFVGPLTKYSRALRTALLPAAQCCTGKVYLTLMPHPDGWQRGCQKRLLLVQHINGAWCQCQ